MNDSEVECQKKKIVRQGKGERMSICKWDTFLIAPYSAKKNFLRFSKLYLNRYFLAFIIINFLILENQRSEDWQN